MKIAIAIPTFNRVNKLKKLIASIESQIYDATDLQLLCVISNSASTDSTREYLDNLIKSNSKVSYVINDKTEYQSDGNIRPVGFKDNFRACINAVPDYVDWVWFMGDDDLIISEHAISELSKLILKNSPELDLVHLCQARRSKGSNKTIKGTLLDLCNYMGFHELLGWMSSICVRNQKIKLAFNSELFLNSKSAYPHSSALLKFCGHSQSLFVDSKWVDPSDKEQTIESIQRWQKENIAERYFYVVDDLEVLVKELAIPAKFSAIFFRYLTYSLWDRYATYITGSVLREGALSDVNKEHLMRVQKIGNFLNNPIEKKLFNSWFSSYSSEILFFLEANRLNRLASKRLSDGVKNLSASVYPFTNLLEA